MEGPLTRDARGIVGIADWGTLILMDRVQSHALTQSMAMLEPAAGENPS